MPCRTRDRKVIIGKPVFKHQKASLRLPACQRQTAVKPPMQCSVKPVPPDRSRRLLWKRSAAPIAQGNGAEAKRNVWLID